MYDVCQEVILQNLTNAKISQSDIARALNITRATVSTRAKNESQLTFEEIKKLEQAYNVNLSQNNNKLLPGDSVELDYFPDVFGSCGNGVFQFSTKKRTYYYS